MSAENTIELEATGQGILDEDLAWEQAAKIQAGYEEARELGIEDRAHDVIVAHGQRYMVAEALVECSEFGESIRNAVESMREAEIPEPTISSVISKTIDKKAAEAAETSIPAQVLERQAAEKASIEAVKKN